jgi:hypothetical protein
MEENVRLSNEYYTAHPIRSKLVKGFLHYCGTGFLSGGEKQIMKKTQVI